MERIDKPKPRGLNTNGLRIWGMLFLLVGILGKSLLQNRYLGMGSISAQELVEGVLSTEMGMTIAASALVMQALETMATPLFCFLLVEGVQHTGDFWKYFGRVAGLALVTELPYNLAMGGKVLDLSTRNPVFGLVLAMILLYLYRRYSQPGFKNVLLKVVFTLAAILWGQMLHISHGACCAILVAILWGFRKKPLYRNVLGCTAAFACCLINPFYMVAPMAFLMLHFYNGEKGEDNRLLSYLAYPVFLLVVGLAAMFLV